ncbi:MAG TPA: MBL fold metallo-hydrolase [Micromonosporaceae bacterium]|nr:MBL fold metallo-hydrolase [Micromonosporaceae bacterium]
MKTELRRLDLGYFIRPASEVGGPEPRVEPVLGYLVRREEGVILFDTGIGAADPETEAHYQPHRRPLQEALAGEVPDLIVNCHLHFDHCGGNALFAGKPILVQHKELELALGENYTLSELVDFDGADYRELDGDAEIWPGVWIIATPGHTDGHQSLVIRQPDGTVVLAGQAHDFASHFGSAVLAHRTQAGGIRYPEWMERLLDFDPRRVLFAHDNSVWEP